MEARADILRNYVDEVTAALWDWMVIYNKQLADNNPDLFEENVAFLDKSNAETSDPNIDLIIKTFKLLQVKESIKWGPNGKV